MYQRIYAFGLPYIYQKSVSCPPAQVIDNEHESNANMVICQEINSILKCLKELTF